MPRLHLYFFYTTVEAIGEVKSSSVCMHTLQLQQKDCTLYPIQEKVVFFALKEEKKLKSTRCSKQIISYGGYST